MIVLRSPKGWTGPKDRRWTEDRGHVPRAPGADSRRRQASRPREAAGKLDEELSRGGTVRRQRDAEARTRRAGAEGRAPHGRQPARQRRHSAARPQDAGFSRLTRSRFPRPARWPRRTRWCSEQFLRDVTSANDGQAQFPHLRSRRDAVEHARRRLRGHQSAVGRPHGRGRRVSRARRPRPQLPAQRASMRGMAGGLSADRPARAVQQLRGLHPHRQFDVQPARQMAEGHARTALAAQDRLAELPARLARLAAGSQRLHPPGPRLSRSCHQQEGGRREGLSAAGRQLPAVGVRPLPAKPPLRERRRRRESTPCRNG